MRKWAAFFLAAALLLALAACDAEPAETVGSASTAGQTDGTAASAQTDAAVPAGSDSSDPTLTGSESTETTSAGSTGTTGAEPGTAESTEAAGSTDASDPEDTAQPQLGAYTDGVYTNAFIGVRCQLDDRWYVYSSEELAQLTGQTADAYTDEAFAEMIRGSGSAFAFFAQDDDNGYTINIVIEDIGELNSVTLTEADYAAISAEQLPASLEALGLENVTCQVSAISFAGEAHSALTIHGIIQDVDFYEVVVCKKIGRYVVSTTVSCYYTDATGELLAMFAAA